LIKANHPKGWDAKPPAYVARKRDTAAGLPGKRSTFGSVLVVCGQTVLEGAMMKTNGLGSKKLSRNLVFFSVLLLALLISVWARAEQVTLAWDANTEPDLAGYRVHYGTASGSYTTCVDLHKVTTSSIGTLAAGQTYYFVVTAYDASGNESGYSNQVSYSVAAANGAPATPATPTGASSALVNASIALSTSATDPNNDSLEYRYDWGDGVISGWGAASQSHSWSAAGSYTVKAQARDSIGSESAAWSSAKTVIISSPPPVDPDSDGDGVPDSKDAFPNDPKEWLDSNGNHIGDNADAAAAAAKQAPDAPLLVSPVNDVVSVMAILKTGAFRTAVSGSTHAKTRWQVFSDENVDVCVLDVQSTTALTSLTVPKLVIEEGTDYYWRAQFIDSMGNISGWSADGYFTTETTCADLNANGIPDVQEVASTVDLDRDGVRDNRQPRYIKSVKMEGTNVQIGVSIKGCSTCIGVESVESEDVRQLDSYAYDKPANMPFALINFKIAVAKPGDTAVVKLYFSKAASYSSKWYQYDAIADRWYDFSAYAKLAYDRRSVTLTLKDGGPGDADGVVNGVIVN
jgi:hypothetical protein